MKNGQNVCIVIWIYGVVGYDVWIFKDGIKVFDETNITWDGAERYGYNSDEYFEHIGELAEQQVKDEAEIKTLWEEARRLALERKHKKEQVERAKKDTEYLQSLEREKEERRQQFEKLKKEFE